jgi:HlyD family secretion protein
MSPNPAVQPLDALLDTPRARWWRRPLTWLAVAAIAVSGAGLAWWQRSREAQAAPSFSTQAVTRGNLRLQVTANGTLAPTRSVNIGSELSGTVSRVLVDVNDRVKKGQVLVELDTAKLSDQVLRSRATLASARAKVAQATATLKEAQGNMARLEDVARLSGGKVPAKSELDTGRAAVDRAVADEASAKASVADAQAALSTDETNLRKASIRSPIDGVVLTRAVDPGNAVAASLQAVTLFTIAEDLTQLRLQVSVDEADVGAVQAGQPASFTVSAYPSRRYPAKVTRVAYGSTTTDNVVTYLTYLDVDNRDLSLRPGMTATATITSTERQNVLLVPNTALRFVPSQARGGTAAADAGGPGGIMGSLMPRMPRQGGGQRRAPGGPAAAPGPAATPAVQRQLWVLQEGRPTPIAVSTGITDGRMTEVAGAPLQEGMQVITEQRSKAQK